jgi:hypothetical protein
VLSPDELRAYIKAWAKEFPSVHAAAQELVRKLSVERFYQIGVVTATKRVNGDVESMSYREAYNVWEVLRDHDQ